VLRPGLSSDNPFFTNSVQPVLELKRTPFYSVYYFRQHVWIGKR
jgi:hypothetical protein